MGSALSEERGPIAFAEKVLGLLDEARYTATYKYAVLLGLIDLCLERVSEGGQPPTIVTTRQLAERVVEIYWPHTMPFVEAGTSKVFRQNVRGQAEILSDISRFRTHHAPDPSTPRWAAQVKAPAAFERLTRKVEWKLIEMPLPRLQAIGTAADPFIYDIAWDAWIQPRSIAFV